MYVCTYVCMYVCMYVLMYMCVHFYKLLASISLQTFLDLFLAAKGTVLKLGADKIKKISVTAEELLEKWPSCDRAQVTDGLQAINELWEQFERDLMEHEEVVY